MTSPDYISRIADNEVERALRAVGAVAIEGPRGCGKTETARRKAASELLLDLDPDIERRLALAPASVLEGPPPRLLDEWQLVPAIWDHVRRAVDGRREPGQFLLTGSSRPEDRARRHSGAGRFATVRMRPLTLWETQPPHPHLSVASLLRGHAAGDTTGDVPPAAMDFSDYLEAIVRGGWPGNLGRDLDAAMVANRGYVDAIVEVDLATAFGARRDPWRIRRFLHAYAQLTAQPARVQTIVDRAAADAGEDGPSRQVVSGPYLDAVRRCMIVDELAAWQPSVRSSVRQIGVPKRHLADPSLAAALLDMSPDRLIADLETLGFLFESLATRDLRVYAQAAGASCAHYRQRDGRGEIDVIVQNNGSGRWVGFEIKLGSNPETIDKAAEQLVRVAATVTAPPAELVVVTSGTYGYRRPQDGVLVVPLAALGP
ncbi:MAG: ATP-binding protein [Mycobacteriales bacterium]